ncbi:MAG TPA: nuclear transport factor 2 family protein [Pseudomonadales bacterium]|jgi:3-phenylpropionate/cinnamic acid dioxygenase small subunit
MDPHYAIQRLLYLYAERIDAGDFEGLADLFAHAAIHSSALREPIRGREAVLALYQHSTRRYPDGTPRTRHLVCNPIVDVVDATHAQARSTFVVLQATDDLDLQPIIAGRYHDRFTRTDGQWHFTAREMLPELKGNLSHHLLFNV